MPLERRPLACEREVPSDKTQTTEVSQHLTHNLNAQAVFRSH